MNPYSYMYPYTYTYVYKYKYIYICIYPPKNRDVALWPNMRVVM